MALVSPLPLDEACDIVGSALAASAFADRPPSPPGSWESSPGNWEPTASVVRSVEAWRQAGEAALVSTADLEASRPFADFGRVRGRAYCAYSARAPHGHRMGTAWAPHGHRM